METGIQLAAIVLGVVPIFRTATGGYRTPSGELAWVLGHSRTALSRNQTHDKLEDFLTNLHYELSVLQMAVEKLVNELDSLYVDEKDALKSGSRQKLWTDPRVTRAVQDRLGSGYETFQIQVTKLLEQLEKLIAKDVGLQLESEKINVRGVFARLTLLQTQRQKAQADSDFSSRFRFNLKEEKRLRILGKISLYNVKIAQLLDYSTPSPVCIEESIKRPSKQSRQRRLRPVMHNLYKAMGKRWPCGDCGKLHQARLCLLKCQSGSDSSKGATDKMYFNMLTSIHRDASSDFCTWVENKICVALDSDLPQPSTSRVTFVLDQPTNDPYLPSSPIGLSRTLSGPTFADPPPMHQRKDSKFSLPSSPISPLPEAAESFHKDASYPIHPKCCTRWHFDGNTLVKLQPTRDKLFVEVSHPGTSLADLLLEKRVFTLRERRILAVILAHSMLHFCESPWLSRHWDKKHLSFFKRTSKNGSQLDVQRPWISTHFEDATFSEDVDDLYRIHKNPSVLALGILLLEIELRAGIEESTTEDDLSPTGEVDCNTSLFTAERLLESHRDDVYERFSKAIEACLKCDFVEDGAPTSLDDDNFRQAVYENIVVPLEEELETGFGLKPEDLGLDKC